MKLKSTLKFIFTLLLLNLSKLSFTQTIPTPELFYFNFDGSGTRIPNLALTPPTGTDTADIMGGLTLGGNLICAGALVGAGGQANIDYVDTHWAPNLNGVSWTISFWTSNIPPSGTLFYILGDGNTGGFRCFTNGVAGANNWILRGPLTDVLIPGGAVMSPTMNTWVYDATAGEIRAYLNNVLVNTVTQSPINLTGTGPLRVGGYTSGTGLPAGGLMDEFRFFNRAIDLTEIELLYSRSNSDSVSFTSCDTAVISPSGNYTWNSSGQYSDTLTNVYCGDSIVYVDLTLNLPTSDSIGVTSCFNYTSPSGSSTWTSSGIYTDTIPNHLGCDSVITINLTINTVDTSVTQNGFQLTSNATGASYQWINCSTSLPISGETNQNFTPSSDGNYAVIVTENGCTDTSACFTIVGLGVDNNAFDNLNVFPNPTSGIVNIHSTVNNNPIQLEVINQLGQTIQHHIINTNQYSLMIDEPAGIYFIRVKNKEGDFKTIRISKK